MSIFMILLFISNNSLCEPSKPLAKLMDTQATAFDFFLFQIFERTKCQTWFGNEDKPHMCMTVIDYDFEDNLPTDSAEEPILIILR